MIQSERPGLLCGRQKEGGERLFRQIRRKAAPFSFIYRP